MNTTLLRMTERRNVGGQCRLFVGLGQLQPVFISRKPDSKGGGYEFRCEDVERRGGELTWCWRVCDTRRHRPLVRKLLTNVIACRRQGRKTRAMQLWDDYREGRAA